VLSAANRLFIVQSVFLRRTCKSMEIKKISMELKYYQMSLPTAHNGCDARLMLSKYSFSRTYDPLADQSNHQVFIRNPSMSIVCRKSKESVLILKYQHLFSHSIHFKCKLALGLMRKKGLVILQVEAILVNLDSLYL
jgi:hypothetical protein